MVMPFQFILTDLLVRSEDALAVVFVDESGEAVDLACAEMTPFEVRLLGAQLGICLRQVAALLDENGLGAARLVHLERGRLHLQVVTLPDGYFLALVQRSPALTGTARRHLQRAARALEREVFAV